MNLREKTTYAIIGASALASCAHFEERKAGWYPPVETELCVSGDTEGNRDRLVARWRVLERAASAAYRGRETRRVALMGQYAADYLESDCTPDDFQNAQTTIVGPGDR